MNRLPEPTRLTLYVDGSCDGNQNVDSETPAGWGVVVIGLIGLTLLGTAAFSEGLGLGEIGETVLTVLGALVVASAHVLNYRACRACDCEHH